MEEKDNQRFSESRLAEELSLRQQERYNRAAHWCWERLGIEKERFYADEELHIGDFYWNISVGLHQPKVRLSAEVFMSKIANSNCYWGAGITRWWERSLSPLWPVFDSWTLCHIWVDFVVGFPPCSEGFSLGLQDSSLRKNQHSKLKFDLETVEKKSHLIKCPLLNY